MSDRWIRVRTDGDQFGGNVVVGRVTCTYLGWVAYDDRHGEKRISLHATQEQATAAVLLRASMSEEELDRSVADIVDHIRELRRMRTELDGPVDAQRVAQVLERANEIGRLWE